MTSPDLADDAEGLIRSLDGVVAARVHTGGRGIDAIHVTARDDHAARSMAAHVRSALLAGLATPVMPARIHVRVDPGPDAPPGTTRNGGGAAAPDTDPPPEGDGEYGEATDRDAPAPDFGDLPRHRIWLVEPRATRGGRFTPRVPDEPATRAPRDPEAAGAGHDLEAGTDDDTDAPGRSPLRRPRLVAVDIDRPGDGRVVCRVSVAYGTLVHRAEAVAVDLPGAAAQAAAQAAVRALVDAGIRDLELNGLREVEIAGREYVLVALRKCDTSRRHRSGSAPIVGSPERSAAEAAVAAANELI